MESLASFAADDGDGVARDRDIWRKESPDCAGDQETRAIGFLPSCAWLGIYAKCALSFVKLPKMQNHWIPLFTIFDKLQECKIQMQNLWRCSVSTSLLP